MTLRASDLQQFSGTEHWYRHTIATDYCYTDGVRYVAREGGAYWLIDDILLFQKRPRIVRYLQTDHFQHWKLTVTDDRRARLTCDDGNGNILFRHRYRYTDFSLPSIEFYLIDKVLLLPSEY